MVDFHEDHVEGMLDWERISDDEIREFLEQIRASLARVEPSLELGERLLALGLKGIDLTEMRNFVQFSRSLEKAYTKILNGEPFTEDD